MLHEKRGNSWQMAYRVINDLTITRCTLNEDRIATTTMYINLVLNKYKTIAFLLGQLTSFTKRVKLQLTRSI